MVINQKAYCDIVHYIGNGCYNGENSLSVETLNVALDALDKQIPHKPELKGKSYLCPSCKKILQGWNYRYGVCKCGQLLESEEKDVKD